MAIHELYRRVGATPGQARGGVRVGDFEIGGTEFVVVADLSAIEKEDQLFHTAAAVGAAGARVMCVRTLNSEQLPYDYKRLQPHELRLFREVRQQTGLKIACEISSAEEIDLVSEYADILQVGARNMQNFALLKRLGRVGHPVLLNRGAGATLHELLCSAEYIASSGNEQIILCECGIRAFEDATHNILDITAVPVLQSLSHLPILVNPSVGTGHRAWIGPVSKAAAAAGADGLVLVANPRLQLAKDSGSFLAPVEFGCLMTELREYLALASRTMPKPSALV